MFKKICKVTESNCFDSWSIENLALEKNNV
jgi:hypothetical protein